MISHAKQLAETLAKGYELAETSMGIRANQSLTEAAGWKEMVEGISDPARAAVTALLLENYRSYRGGLDEATTTLQVGNFDKFAFPILSIVSENLVAQDLVSVQPLGGPSGQVFFMNFVAGQQKGDVARGTKIWDARTAHADRYLDSSDRIDNEAVGTSAGDGSLASGMLSYGPVMPGTVSLVDGTNTIIDDANGVLTKSGSGVGTINYNTGAITASAGAFENATAITGSYNYNSELNDNAQQVDFEIQSSPIYVQERKLRGRWSTEAAQSLEALHKVNAENMVSTAIANHLQWEIDREITEDLRRQAGAGLVKWDARIPSGSHISFTEHKLSMQDAAINASNFILRATNRVAANWMLTGIQGAGVVRTLPNFEPVGGEKAEFEGVHLMGSWQGMKVYCDPHYRVDEALIGYKGNDFVRTGYIFAPWILLFSTPLITLDDFIARKGFASQYGKRMINNKFYAKLRFTGFSASYGNPGG